MPDHCSAVRSMQVIRHGFMRPCQHRPGQKRPSEVSRMLWARSGEFAVWDVGIVNMRSPVLDNWSRSGSRGNEKVAKAFDFSCCRLATPHRPQQHCSSPSATGVIQQINIVLLKRFRRHIISAVALLSACTRRSRVQSTRNQQTLIPGKFPKQCALKFSHASSLLCGQLLHPALMALVEKGEPLCAVPKHNTASDCAEHG